MINEVTAIKKENKVSESEVSAALEKVASDVVKDISETLTKIVQSETR